MVGQDSLVEDPHDVVVVELSERLCFVSAVPRDLHCNETLHRLLPCEEHAAECAGSQGSEQVEVVDSLPGFHVVESDGVAGVQDVGACLCRDGEVDGRVRIPRGHARFSHMPLRRIRHNALPDGEGTPA